MSAQIEGRVPDARHKTFTIRPIARGAGLALPIPGKVTDKFGWIQEQVQFQLTVHNDGTLILKPEARPCKWALSENQI